MLSAKQTIDLIDSSFESNKTGESKILKVSNVQGMNVL